MSKCIYWPLKTNEPVCFANSDITGAGDPCTEEYSKTCGAYRDTQKRIKDQLEIFSEGSHNKALRIHSRALAAHCECLAMNAENMSMAMVRPDCTPPYSDIHYLEVMKKWNLINEKGEPLI